MIMGLNEDKCIEIRGIIYVQSTEMEESSARSHTKNFRLVIIVTN